MEFLSKSLCVRDETEKLKASPRSIDCIESVLSMLKAKNLTLALVLDTVKK